MKGSHPAPPPACRNSNGRPVPARLTAILQPRTATLETTGSLIRWCLPLLLAQAVEQRAALVRRVERAGRRRQLDHLVQFLPGRTGATGGSGMRLRRDRVVLHQQHAEQDELRRLHVEDVVVEGVRPQLFGDPQKLWVDLARELEPR